MIIGLEDWKIPDDTEPDQVTVEISVSIDNDSLALKKIRDPEHRRKEAECQRNLVARQLITDFQIETYVIQRRGYQVDITTTLAQLDRISAYPGVNHIIVRRTSPGRRRKIRKALNYWCLKLQFIIQIEGRKKGLISVEEQFVLVKAKSREIAEEWVRAYAADYETPYMNTDGHWVRWKFHGILDAHEPSLQKPFAVDGPVELFSSFQRRRMKPSDYWDGQW
ncbi:DUF4288 domain-containing protein [Fibrella sp. WM1]|uniref:DUF4288 domain-containing protein n=1 Tax=Fibrella musci TaxID=3242485 RepID=UPI00352169CB